MVDKLWDSLGEFSTGDENNPPSPLWCIDFDDEERVLEWFGDTISKLRDEQDDYREEWRTYKELYKGNHCPKVPFVPRDQDRTERRRRTRKVTINHLYEFVEQWVSKMTRFKPTISVAPANAEHQDRQAAKIAKLVIDYLFYLSDMDMHIERMARAARIYGEVYMKVCWNPDKGPLSPDMPRDEEGREQLKGVKDEDGNPIYQDRPIRVGEVDFKIVPPWRMYLEPRSDYRCCNYCIEEETVDIEELKALYPDKADELDKEVLKKEEMQVPEFFRTPKGKIKVFEIYHKSSELLESGRFIKLTSGVVLENIDLPYSHGQLPYVRLTDIDIPDELRGVSSFSNLAPLNLLMNNLATLMYRNIAIASHPKWLVRKGSVNFVQLGNGITICEYTGEAPRLETPQTIRPELFQLKKDLREDSEKIAGIHGVSRGEPPPGIRAGIALQFLEEQENQRANTAIVKHNAMIRDIARLAIATAGDFYDEDDGRLVRVVGKENQFVIKSLQDTDLSRPFDIRVQNSSSLPESKAGRIQTVLDLWREFKEDGLLTARQVSDMLQLGEPDKFYSLVSVAIKKAESENEDMLEGRDVPEPQPWEEHLSHWEAHMKAIQGRSFEQVPEESKEKIFDHILTHELLMYEAAELNPALQEKLGALEGYPAFLRPNTPEPAAQPSGQGAGQMPPSSPPDGQLPPDPLALPPMPEGAPVGVPQAMPTDVPPPAQMPPNIPVPER